jgi:hypothetical protein
MRNAHIGVQTYTWESAIFIQEARIPNFIKFLSSILEFYSSLLDSRQTDGRLERSIWIGASQRYEHA